MRLSSCRRTGRVLVAAVLIVAVSAGCSSSGGEVGAAARSGAASASAGAAKPRERIRPARVDIPAIGARSSLTAVGVTRRGELAVPSAREPMQAAWYRLSSVPGEAGPAIVLGHVDGFGRPGIFHDLGKLAAGDEIVIAREDGERLTFVVAGTSRVPKDEFPTEALYGYTDEPTLRLITCGGVFDDAEHDYADNIVVDAVLA